MCVMDASGTMLMNRQCDNSATALVEAVSLYGVTVAAAIESCGGTGRGGLAGFAGSRDVRSQAEAQPRPARPVDARRGMGFEWQVVRAMNVDGLVRCAAAGGPVAGRRSATRLAAAIGTEATATRRSSPAAVGSGATGGQAAGHGAVAGRAGRVHRIALDEAVD